MEVRKLRRWKKEAYSLLIQRRCEAYREKCKRAKLAAKRGIKQRKRRAAIECCRRLVNNFSENKKLF